MTTTHFVVDPGQWSAAMREAKDGDTVRLKPASTAPFPPASALRLGAKDAAILYRGSVP